MFLDHPLLIFHASVHGQVGEGDGALSVGLLVGGDGSGDDRVESSQLDDFVAGVFAVLEEVAEDAGADARHVGVASHDAEVDDGIEALLDDKVPVVGRQRLLDHFGRVEAHVLPLVVHFGDEDAEAAGVAQQVAQDLRHVAAVHRRRPRRTHRRVHVRQSASLQGGGWKKKRG